GMTAIDGALSTFTYDAAGRLWQVLEPGGRTVTLTHDTPGNLTGIQNPDGAQRTLGYATPADHRATADNNAGVLASWSYDRFMAWAASTGSAADGSLGTAALTPAAHAGLGSASYGAPQAVATDALGHVTNWSLDLQGRPLQQTAADG